MTTAATKLSVVIACLNDAEEVNKTARSILDNAHEPVEIVVVDDCSGTPTWLDEDLRDRVRMIHNRWRCGVGPSRHIGALAATGDWLLITDSHMRFTKDWSRIATEYTMFDKPNTLWCATCLEINSKNMDPEKATTVYHGATYNWHGPDRQNPALQQVLECVWLPREQTPPDSAEIPAVMGAGYLISKEWFLRTSPLRYLRSWGCDELMLAMKTWLSGGQVRMATNLRLGHKFRLKGEPQWFNNPPGDVLWNKLLAAWTLFPTNTALFFEGKILSGPKESGRDREAAKIKLRNEWHIIAQERERNRALFVRDAKWLCDRFGLLLP